MLILTGKQDSIVGYADAYSIIENYHRVRFLALDGAGHNLEIEQPEIFSSHMKNWLRNFLHSVINLLYEYVSLHRMYVMGALHMIKQCIGAKYARNDGNLSKIC